MIRSSRATTALIAEGYGRFHFKENIQCCRQSRGELYELLDHLIVAKDEAFVDESAYAEARQSTIRAIELVNGYIRYLQRQDALEARKSAETNGRRKNLSSTKESFP
jgi:four helix bundle protein